MEIRKLHQSETADFKTLIEIFRNVFEKDAETPHRDHLNRLLSNPDFIVFVVKVNGKVVGGLTIYVLHQYYSEKPLAYIYDVGIATDFQGKGLGKALIAAVCNFCKANGFEEAFVQAESDDSEAINFYRKTEFSNELSATHFTCSFADDSKQE